MPCNQSVTFSRTLANHDFSYWKESLTAPERRIKAIFDGFDAPLRV